MQRYGLFLTGANLNDYTVQISWTETDNITSDYTGGIIHWNPYLAVEFNTGYVQSPAEALVHEAAHARNKNKDPNAYDKRTKENDSKYKDKEEKEVITNDEQECARKLGKLKNGQVTRHDHFGVETYRQEDPTKSEVEEPEK